MNIFYGGSFELKSQTGLLVLLVAMLLAPISSQGAIYEEISPSSYTFAQTGVAVDHLADPDDNRAVDITATVEFTNNSGSLLEGVRLVWAWGIGYHLYNSGPDAIFERQWDPFAERFMFSGHDSFYDGEFGTSMEILSASELMAFSDTDLDPNADAEDFTWLGVDTGHVPLSAYPDLYVDPTSSIPYNLLGDVLPGETVSFEMSTLTEYPNDPIPNQIGLWGLPTFVQLSSKPVPEPATTALVILTIATAVSLRRRHIG